MRANLVNNNEHLFVFLKKGRKVTHNSLINIIIILNCCDITTHATFFFGTNHNIVTKKSVMLNALFYAGITPIAHAQSP